VRRSPAIWLLPDDETRIWLFGTNHVLPHAFAWRSPDLDAIIKEVAELFGDTEECAELMMLDEPVPVLDRVSCEYLMRLCELLKYSNIETEELDPLKT